MVTDHIATFTPAGIRLKSGEELPADIVVSATGLKLEVLNGIKFTVDGRAVDASQTMGYKGMMYDGVPNLALVVRLHQRVLDAEVRPDLRICLPGAEPHGQDRDPPGHPAQRRPQHRPRAVAGLLVGLCPAGDGEVPQAGIARAWKLHQNYARDLMSLRYAKIEDGVLEFSNPKPATAKVRDKVAA